MTKLEKHSFYSFLGLYVISSFLLIALVGYWYLVSQGEILKNQTHYKLEHVIDQEASKVIYAHMQGMRYQYAPPMGEISLSLLDVDGNTVYGSKLEHTERLVPGLHTEGSETMLVSSAPKGHLGIALIVAKTRTLSKEIATLKQQVLEAVLLIMLMVGMIAWMLSKIFMRPLRQRVSRIESFINDVTHELNTPITSLSMAAEQASRTGACPQRILNHISISTRQLYDIYRSLSYLNFSPDTQTDEVSHVDAVLRESLAYYEPLAQIKKITFDVRVEPCQYLIPSQQLSLLFGNLIGNAIKYSPALSVITVTLEEGICMIQDEGIGIEKAQQEQIFEKFKRATRQSGGFGIGLSVVKSISQRYAIPITLDSEENRGTRFILHFK